LWIQMDSQKTKELKNTAKFLERLLFLNVGLSVYKTPKAILITLGGTNNSQNTLDLSTGINAAMSGNFTDIAYDLMNASGPTTVYFESVFDKKLQQFKKEQQDPLAVDFISKFLKEHDEVSMQNTFRYKNYYIFGYYDTYTKEYVMRKFIDGFDRSF
jgi:hypothetical protein